MPEFVDSACGGGADAGRRGRAPPSRRASRRARPASTTCGVTVILAAVLFLIAIGQRFKIRGVRYAVNIVAGVFLVYCAYLIAAYPHA